MADTMTIHIPPYEPADAVSVEAAYRAMVRQIGFGFHPDTRGRDYMDREGRRFSASDAAAIDALVSAAFALLSDPREIAIEVLDHLDLETGGHR